MSTDLSAHCFRSDVNTLINRMTSIVHKQKNIVSGVFKITQRQLQHVNVVVEAVIILVVAVVEVTVVVVIAVVAKPLVGLRKLYHEIKKEK